MPCPNKACDTNTGKATFAPVAGPMLDRHTPSAFCASCGLMFSEPAIRRIGDRSIAGEEALDHLTPLKEAIKSAKDHPFPTVCPLCASPDYGVGGISPALRIAFCDNCRTVYVNGIKPEVLRRLSE